VIYLDSSALVKLVFEEAESAQLVRWLADRSDDPKLSSEVATIELVRTCRCRDPGSEAGVRQLLRGLDLVPVTTELIERATLVGPPELRSLDAIHLASVLSFREDVTHVVVYDARLSGAVAAAGLEVVAPT
jgi:uncharacterized protein